MFIEVIRELEDELRELRQQLAEREQEVRQLRATIERLTCDQTTTTKDTPISSNPS